MSDSHDIQKAPRIAIVNQLFADQFFPRQNPVGRHFTMGKQDVQIVGFVRNSYYQQLREKLSPLIYLPIKQTESSNYTVLVRTALPEQQAITEMKHAVQAVDPKLPMYGIRLMQDLIDDGITSERILTFLAAIFSGLVTLLCCMGVYGLIAYAVSRRTREVGVRFAIGAQKRDVAQLFFRESALLLLAGVILGIPLALASARVLKSLLYGVEPTDTSTLFLTVSIFILAGLGATILPVRKATLHRTHPSPPPRLVHKLCAISWKQMNALLASIAEKKAQLGHARPLSGEALANLQRYYDIELTYASNAIEGNTLSAVETTLVIEKGITVSGKPLKDHLEALDHYDAIRYVRELARQTNAFSESDVRNLHRLVVQRSRPEIAGAYADLPRFVRTETGRHVFPSPAEIPALMGDFAGWLAHAPADPASAFTAHLRLVGIHPLNDGNGRTARLLMNLILLRAGYPPISVRPEDRLEYIRSLQVAQSGGSADGFDLLLHQRLNATLEEYLRSFNEATPC